MCTRVCVCVCVCSFAHACMCVYACTHVCAITLFLSWSALSQRQEAIEISTYYYLQQQQRKSTSTENQSLPWEKTGCSCPQCPRWSHLSEASQRKWRPVAGFGASPGCRGRWRRPPTLFGHGPVPVCSWPFNAVCYSLFMLLWVLFNCKPGGYPMWLMGP